MDPNAALNSILRGHMIADHAEALRDWLRAGGFEPEPIWLPAATTPEFDNAFAHECDIVATFQGLEQNDELVFSWRELMQMSDED